MVHLIRAGYLDGPHRKATRSHPPGPAGKNHNKKRKEVFTMTNNQIIRNEAARLDLATLHAIATAHHTPAFSAAVVAPVQGCFCCLPKGSDSPLYRVVL